MEYGMAGRGWHDEEKDVLGTWARALSDNFGEIWHHILYVNLTQARVGSYGIIGYKVLTTGGDGLGAGI